MRKRKMMALSAAVLAFSLLMVSCGTLDLNPKGVGNAGEELKEKAGFKSDILKNLRSDNASVGSAEPTAEEAITADEQLISKDKDLIELIESNRQDVRDVISFKPKEWFSALFKGREDADEKLMVSLNFDNPDINQLVPVFAAWLGANYYIDPRVKGAVDMVIHDQEMSKREIAELFESILWLSGAFCTYDNGLLRILPFSTMPMERRILVDHQPQSNVQVEMFYLINSKAANVANQIKPFLTEGAQVIVLPTNKNSMLVVDSPANMPKINALIKLLDTEQRTGWPRCAIYCTSVPASQVQEELEAILPVLGYLVTSDKAVAEPGSIHLTSVDRLRVIVASAANREAINEVKRWVGILDQDDVGEQERVYVYKVINSRSDELMEAVSTIFNTDGSSISSASAKGGKGKASTKKSKSRAAQVETVVNVFDSPIKIFADGIQNRLVIRTTPRTYAMLKAVLMRLDTVPSQVLLQVMIAEVTLNEENEYGLEYGGMIKGVGGDKNYNAAIRTDWLDMNRMFDPATQSWMDNIYGANYTVYNKNDPDKFMHIRAQAGEGNTRVLSAPQIVAVSDKEATIEVGDQVPIVTKENSNTESGTSFSREIQYEDTGIILKITPHITKGDLVTLEIDQTVSDAVKTTTSDIDSPTIQKRQLTTSLSIRDGSTLIVGGLIWDRKIDNRTSLPVLIKIPIVSNLIGYNNITRKRVELLLIITATVIREDTDLQEKVRRYKNAVKLIEDSSK